MLHTDCEDGVSLVPLKENRCPGTSQAVQRPEPSGGKCSRPEQREQHAQGECGCVRASGPKFVDSREWQWTREVCNGLFRAFGKYYDEKWFPTVIREWSLLYYQCTHECDYWQKRDEWLAGDEEIRNTVWNAILFERTKVDEHLKDLMEQQQRRNPDGNCNEAVDEEEAQKVVDLHDAINEADELIEIKRMDAQQIHDQCLPVPTKEEKQQAELEAAELQLANPDDDPDWVDMRRKMRGSFAALHLARSVVSQELLEHIMIELCRYWANLPGSFCNEIDPLLRRNILREISNFRLKLFNVVVDCEPEQNPIDEPLCPIQEEPEEPAAQPECPQPAPSRNAAECPPAPTKKPAAARPKSRGQCPPPATNKLAEARAKRNAARMQK